MVITELDIGGAERAFVRIAIGLKQRGWTVRVISLRDAGQLAAELAGEHIEVKALGCGGMLDVRAVVRLKSEFQSHRPDVVLSFLHQANLISRLAAWWAGIRRVVCGIRVADRRLGVTLPDRWTRGLVTRYVAVSQTVATVHAKSCRLNPTPDVIRNGVDLDAISRVSPADRANFGCQLDDIVVLCAGRLTEQKAPLDALDGFLKLRSKIPDNLRDRLRLLFVGDGPLSSDLSRRIHDGKLEHCVKLLGWRSDVWSLMKSANVLLLASKWEGLPNVLMEAQAARLAVVASAIDGNTELIEHGITGRLFPVDDTDQMASQLLAAIQESGQTQRMVETAHAAVSRLTWEASIDAYDRLLKMV